MHQTNISPHIDAAKERPILPAVDDVIAAIKARFIDAANRNEPERVMPDVAALMAGGALMGDPTETPLQLVVYAHGLHEAAKVARQHGQLRQADIYHDLGQVLLDIAADGVGGLVAAIAHFAAVKH